MHTHLPKSRPSRQCSLLYALSIGVRERSKQQVIVDLQSKRYANLHYIGADGLKFTLSDAADLALMSPRLLRKLRVSKISSRN